MTTAFATLQQYAQRLPVTIALTDPAEQMLVLDAPHHGIHKLILDCEDDILIIEQFITPLPAAGADEYRTLLQINRNLVHGALCLDESGERLIFRDTLQLENLDFNELEGSVNALSLMLAEYANTFIEFSRHGEQTA